MISPAAVHGRPDASIGALGMVNITVPCVPNLWIGSITVRLVPTMEGTTPPWLAVLIAGL